MSDAVIDPHARRAPEPEYRRSHQPVRRKKAHQPNQMAGGWEEKWFRPMTWREAHELLRATRAYDRANKKPGDRHGPIGPIGIELLEELLALAVNCKGTVWPRLDTLQKRLCRSRDTIVRVMRKLADAQILEWVRRIVPKADGSRWQRGPQVEQTSSVYRMSLPARLRRFVKKAPPPADDETRRKTMVDELRRMAGDEFDAKHPQFAAAAAKAAADARASKPPERE